MKPSKQQPHVKARSPVPVRARDQYIPGGDIGVWQGALRDPDDPLYATLTAATAEQRRFLLDLLYTDQVGGQRTISRFGLLPGDDGWLTAAARHWYLDAPAPAERRREGAGRSGTSTQHLRA
jgi:hypothetical protein